MAETVKENQELDSSTLEAIELFKRVSIVLDLLAFLLGNYSKEEMEKPLLVIIDGVLTDISAAVKDFGFTGLPFEKKSQRLVKVLETYKEK